MPDVSIAISAQDRYSSAIKAMSQASKAFSKDMEAMERRLESLSRNKYALKLDADEAKKRLRELEKQFAATGDEADGLKAQLAAANYDNIKRNLDLVTRAGRDTERQMLSTGEAFRKSGDQAGGFGSGIRNTLSALGVQLAAPQAAELLQQIAGGMATSALGGTAGGIVSSALSSALSGGTLGFSIGGPVGAAVGAAAGGILGAISGGVQEFSGKDEAFKTYYTGMYESAGERRAAELSAGTDIASGRETDLISFTTLFGDEETARRYLSDLVDMANATPFLYDDLTAMSKTLATYGYGADDILPTLTTVGDTGAALGMSTQDMTMVATALGRMKSSDKATLEYLNILNDRGIGAVGMLAAAKEVDQGTMYEMISRGKITGGEAVEIILEALETRFAGDMEDQSRTYAGRSSTLEGLEKELANALGEAYNETAKAGIAQDIAAWDGELGNAMTAMNAVIGEGRGLAENLERQYTREALEAVLLGKDSSVYSGEQEKQLQSMHQSYQELMGRFETASDGEKAGIAAQIEALKSQAESFAETAYSASETGIALKDAELSLIEAIRENTAALGKEAYLQDYEKQLEADKGRLSTDAGWDDLAKDNLFLQMAEINANNMSLGGGILPYAYGLNRVPYDGYAAVLHEGERVLTASQARMADTQPGSVSVTVTGNTFHVRSDGDVTAVAEELVRQIRLKRMGGLY